MSRFPPTVILLSLIMVLKKVRAKLETGSFQPAGSKWSAPPDLEKKDFAKCWKTSSGHCESESVDT